MNLVPKQICLAAISLALLFAGCNHTPVRPTPPETNNNANDGNTGLVNSQPVKTEIPPPPPPPPLGFETRPATGIGAEGDRTLLVPVYFDFDKSIIKPGEVAKIQAAVKYLGEHPDQRLLLEGHCDWRGTAEYNLGLGDRRATAVKQYLAKLKVPMEKLDTLSKGSIGAVEKGTEEQMGKDRRVELVVMMAGAPPPAPAAPAAP
jgi:peptidoglycan-associated lipoprotein